VVRSCAGNVPLFVRPERNGVCVTTRLTALWRHVPVAPEIDRLVEMTWVAWGGDPFNPRTIFRDTWAVPTGHLVRTGPRVPFRAERYWRVPARSSRLPDADETSAHAERLRELLVATLDRDLAADGLNMLTLSGGADSGSLAVLATRRLQRRVGALSLVPPAGHPSTDHMVNLIQGPVTEAGLAPWMRVPWSDLKMLDLIDGGAQCAFPVVHGAFLSLPMVRYREPFCVLFGGEDADVVCGSVLTLADWVAATPASAILRSQVGLPGRRARWHWMRWRAAFAMGSRSPGELSPRALPPWVHPDIRLEYRDRLQDVRERVVDHGEWPGVSYWLRRDTYITQGWEVTAPLGIRRSLPFRAREVLELAFSCHPSELIGPGYKKLLRAALRDDVPAAILDRPKDHWPHERAETYVWPHDRVLPAELADFFAPESLPGPSATLPADVALALTRVAVTMTHRRELRSAPP
ncbi:MAG: asparagine synthase-related protein, partial [Acidimicrobiia bacterium]|nr:asparagine synthase-related protein [Acidimicrobiia bacterium]